MEYPVRLDPVHPGDVIREDFLVPLGKSAYWLAKGLGITETAAGEILRGRRGVTPATALRLERFLGCSAEFWLGLQAAYELDVLRSSLEEPLQAIEPADLRAMTQERQQAVASRRQPLVDALSAERNRLAGELEAIQPYEQQETCRRQANISLGEPGSLPH